VTRSHDHFLFRTPGTGAILTAFDLLEIARRKPVHFMGIGGAGMSPLAELIHRSGGTVTGCDAHPGASAAALARLGIAVAEGHHPSHTADAGALVLTAAVPLDHPEVVAARERGIPVLKRAEALGAIVNHGTVVAIAGTHGKTTTTALTTAALAAGDLDPTGLVGGRVPAWGGNLRLGSERLFVVEADEYDRSFLTLRPAIAVVTTLEADHLDIYGSLAGVEEGFHAFLEQVAADGLIIGCADDTGVGRLLPRVAGGATEVLTYGLSAGSMLRAENVRPDGMGSRFSVRERGRLLGDVQLSVPGLHNVRNSLAAIGVALRLGVRWKDVVAGIGAFNGVDRRFQQIGEAGGVRVVDDYAHHPTEIEATLQAARASAPGCRIVAIFQPHLFSRTRDFAAEFGRALARADLVVLTSIYPAREQPIAGVTSALVVDTTRAAGAEVVYVPDRADVVEAVAPLLRAGDLCITLGAGDLDRAARELLERLALPTVEPAR
jgi:UDP-N-acetylmuramate--alanine ligase